MRNKHRAAHAVSNRQAAQAAEIPAQHLLSSGGLLRLPQVLALAGVSKSTWWKLVRDGRAPAAIKLTDRCTAWRAADVAEWIENAGGKGGAK